MISDPDLRLLAASRWHMPVLAVASRDGGTRFAVLLRELGPARSALARCLAELQGYGWVERNPGHGHPLRPEYRLTASGEELAGWCARVMAARREIGLEPADLSRWSLPLLARLDRGWSRFSVLQGELDPITPRALSLTLKGMLDRELACRKLEDGFPPTSLYGIGNRGRVLAEVMR